MHKEKIEQILKEFSELLEREVISVKVDGVDQEVTPQDQIDFMKSCWETASEKLYELGIETNY
ncbi:hypothetical protein [Clostridium sp. 1001275B_160808_H3]|uniref:hypothetical protein n=1 Tax=Clostridium sp. 1001275B_160808_H3 TaxID=2787110 RepID=UPI0018975069|nr:hypothetical protein [Clostridium sp. 1001275B_160808_H3]